MLQQTQVPRVAEVYEEFVAAYPSIDDVAQADLTDVRRITDPLGYKARGGYIKRLADEVVEYRAGRVPDTVPELMQLPGVGRYTAGAVMTFAHGRATPIVDTNVARVLGRWFADSLPPGDSDGRARQASLGAVGGAAAQPRAGPAARRLGAQPGADGLRLAGLRRAQAPLRRLPVRRRCHYPSRDRPPEPDVVVWLEG